jgi:hypothetical protein
MSDPRLPTLTDETTIVASASVDFVVEPGDTQDGLLERWKAGQRCLFDGLSPLTMTDGSRIHLTWGEPPWVSQTITRQLTRPAYRAGQVLPPA